MSNTSFTEINHHHLWSQYSEKIFITTDSGAKNHKAVMKVGDAMRYFDQFDIATIIEAFAQGLTVKQQKNLFKHMLEKLDGK